LTWEAALTFVIFFCDAQHSHNRGMNTPSFSLREEDVVLADPEAFADRLAEFLRSQVSPDPTDRDLVLMFVDRLFLGLCDDFDDEELMRGAQVQLAALSKDQVASLRAMQARAKEIGLEVMTAKTGH
jgi:hypothetical protein